MTQSREIGALSSAAAMTPGSVIRGEQPILHVTHQVDGTWTAHGPEPPSFQDVWEGSLSVLWALDGTLAELADLPRGWSAERDAASQAWRRAENPLTDISPPAA